MGRLNDWCRVQTDRKYFWRPKIFWVSPKKILSALGPQKIFSLGPGPIENSLGRPKLFWVGPKNFLSDRSWSKIVSEGPGYKKIFWAGSKWTENIFDGPILSWPKIFESALRIFCRSWASPKYILLALVENILGWVRVDRNYFRPGPCRQ